MMTIVETVEALPSLTYGTSAYTAFIDATSMLAAAATPAEVQAAVEYTGWTYRDCRNFLSGVELGANTARVQAQVDALEAFIGRAGRFDEITVYRGVRYENGETWDEIAERHTPGNLYRDLNFLSTTLEPRIAAQTVKDGEGYIFILSTTEGAALGDETSEQGLREREYLLPRGKQWRSVRQGMVDVAGARLPAVWLVEC